MMHTYRNFNFLSGLVVESAGQQRDRHLVKEINLSIQTDLAACHGRELFLIEEERVEGQRHRLA